MRRSKIILALTAAASLLGVASTASAAPYGRHDHERFQHHHPRQHQVMVREHRQLARINHERRQGEISGPQARQLRAETRDIGHDMRADARANGGHITRQEHHALNQRLNAQSRAIGH